MVGDRELLEMAAKAAGLTLSSEWDAVSDGILIGAGEGDLEVWNPLTDDGDALRLAVRLGLVVKCPVRQDGRDAAAVSRGSLLAQVGAGDPFDDTRRAIVMAAAQLGKHL